MQQDTQEQLKEYRDSIDNIDAALVFLLSERFKITHKVGVLKAENTLLPADKSREAQQVSRLRKLSKEADLDPDFTEKILNFIIAEVISNHQNLRDSKETS
jgi:chorismate mutase